MSVPPRASARHKRIPGPNRPLEIPNPPQEFSVSETLARPISKILDGLIRRRRVETSQPVVPPDDADHLDINDGGRSVVGIDGEPRPDIVGSSGVCDTS